MDRGRVGTLAIGNKAIREGMIKHQQDVHMERISKIKNRKPGSSNTLDNTAPVVVKAALNNPRKAALKLEFNTVTERENKVLLQKISAILTAPPKITDEDYVRMRKIVQNLKGGKQMYEEAIQMKHHKIYLKHLKTMGPYYKPKEWELDYRRQLRQQKFMRQVTYTRPKGFKDPLVRTDNEAESFAKPRASSAPLGSEGSRSSAHIHRIRDVKEGINRHQPSSSSNINGNDLQRAGNHHVVTSYAGADGGGGVESSYDLDQFEDNDQEIEAQEQLEELAHVRRAIRVTTSIAGDFDRENGGGEAEGEEDLVYDDCIGEVNCSLVDKTILVISTSAKQGAQTPAFNAEAEIDIIGLAELRGISEEMILADTSQLASLANFIAQSVEVRIENGTARIILNLAESALENDDDPEAQNNFFLTGDENSLQNANGEENEFLGSGGVEEEGSALLDDNNISHVSGVSIPVRSVFGKKKDPNLPVRTKKDVVLAIAQVNLEDDEEISVTVQICSNSDTKFRGKPAVTADTKLKLKTGLPSIMRADVELLSAYFRSISENLVVECHSVSGAVTLTLTSGDTAAGGGQV